MNEGPRSRSVMLVELTIPFTIEAANKRKRERYEFLSSDINNAGYRCSNLPLEVTWIQDSNKQGNSNIFMSYIWYKKVPASFKKQ